MMCLKSRGILNYYGINFTASIFNIKHFDEDNFTFAYLGKLFIYNKNPLKLCREFLSRNMLVKLRLSKPNMYPK